MLQCLWRDSDVQAQLHKDASGTSTPDTKPVSSSITESRLEAAGRGATAIIHGARRGLAHGYPLREGDLGLVQDGDSVGCMTGHCDMEHVTCYRDSYKRETLEWRPPKIICCTWLLVPQDAFPRDHRWSSWGEAMAQLKGSGPSQAQ